MKIAVTPADQELARLDIALAERLGEEVDPAIKMIAAADLSPVYADTTTTVDRLPDDPPSTDALFLDDQTGEPVAVLKYLNPDSLREAWKIAAKDALSAGQPDTSSQHDTNPDVAEEASTPDFVEALVREAGMPPDVAVEVVAEVFEALAAGLARGHKVSFPGFGTLEMRERTARTGRNPQTGALIEIAASRVLSFTPSASLRSRVGMAEAKRRIDH